MPVVGPLEQKDCTACGKPKFGWQFKSSMRSRGPKASGKRLSQDGICRECSRGKSRIDQSAPDFGIKKI